MVKSSLGDLSDLNICIDSYKNTNDKMPVILWLGTQLHAINQPHLMMKFHHYYIKKKIWNIYFDFFSTKCNQEHFLLLHI